MLMIVAGHLIGGHTDVTLADSLISQIVRCFTICAVNVFVIISGYFSIKFSIKRLFSIELQVFFYLISSLVLVTVIGCHSFDFKKDILVLVPLMTKQYWFMTAYVALVFLSPWLNLFVKKLSKKEYRVLLIVLLLWFYLIPSFCFLVNAGQLVPDAGYGIVNFVSLYLFGGYINKYGLARSYPKQYFLYGFVAVSLTLFLLQLFISKLLGFPFTSWLSYNTFFVLFSAVFLFLYFEKLIIHSPIINNVALPCLACYLFHQSPYIQPFFRLGDCYHNLSYLCCLLIYPLLIYAFSFFIEKLRFLVFARLEKKVIAAVLNMRLLKDYQNFTDHLL